jgi:YYY domain-containing protein
MGETMLWWLALELIGLAGLPLTTLVFANLPDRGWTFAKPFSLLMLGWLVWFPLSLISVLPFNRLWIVATLLLYLAGNLALVWRVGRVRSAIILLLAKRRGYLAVTEALFFVAFAVMVWERSFNAGVVDTEKFMDVAFLSAIWRAPHLPPPDPWLSGQPINYYYFGHYLIALVAKVADTVPAVAFNLGVGLIFALTAVAIFGVASNLFAMISPSRRWPWSALAGILSTVFVLMLGNLNGAQVWWQNALDLSRQLPALYSTPWAWWLHRDVWTRYDWWAPSRVIPNTINEFPAFSFVLADLHAHVLALPFATVAVGIALSLVLGRGAGVHAFGKGRVRWLALAACGVALGGLYAINGWDLPTYLGLALLALAIQQWLAHDRRFSTTLLADYATVTLILGTACVLCYLPFYRNYTSPGEGVGVVPAYLRSPVGYEAAIFGLPLFIIFSLAALRLIRRWPAPGAQVSIAVGLVLALASWLSPGLPLWTLLWVLLIIAVCFYLAADRLGLRFGRDARRVIDTDDGVERGDTMRAAAWLWCLVGTAAALIAVCELVFLRDIFAGGDQGTLGAAFRMNTIFKLYYQSWLLLGIVAGPALLWLLAGAFRTLTEVGRELVYGVIRPAAVGKGSGAFLYLDDADALAAFPTDGMLMAAVPPDDMVPGGTRETRGASRTNGGIRTGPDGLRLLSAGGIVFWIIVCFALIGAAAIYPVLATSARTNNFTLERTLDGTAYMDTDSVNQGDAQAIAWLNGHVAGNPVIVEGALYKEYTHYGRISAFTGLPTIMGWGGHEVQWRFTWLQQPEHSGVIDQRQTVVDQIYSNPSQQQVMSLLHQYSVQYVYVGAAEHQLYPSANLGRFATFLRVVYHSADVTIYAVP